MFHHAMKSQARVMLPVALLAVAALLSACGHNSSNSSPSAASSAGSASPMATPQGQAASAAQTEAVAKTPTISAPNSASPTSAPQGSAASATQIAAPATTPAFKEVTAGQILVTLVPTVKPTIHTYPGVQADILGIRIGMTVAHAEAIAAKTYPGKPVETKSSLSVNHGGISAQSQSFISQVVFQKGSGFQNGAGDILTLYFSNPTTGNVVYGIDRSAIFKDASKQPLMTVVMSDLIKKYGPASNPYEHWWQFGEQSLKPCNLGQCSRPGKDVVMGIYAQLNSGAGDRTKVMFLTMRMNDYQLGSESTATGNSQLIAAVEAEQKILAKRVVPAQALTGTYVTTADTKPAGSIDFISGTTVNVLSGNTKVHTTYTINGRQLLIDAEHGNVTFTIDTDGCLDGPDNSKFCKK